MELGQLNRTWTSLDSRVSRGMGTCQPTWLAVKRCAARSLSLEYICSKVGLRLVSHSSSCCLSMLIGLGLLHMGYSIMDLGPLPRVCWIGTQQGLWGTHLELWLDVPTIVVGLQTWWWLYFTVVGLFFSSR